MIGAHLPRILNGAHWHTTGEKIDDQRASDWRTQRRPRWYGVNNGQLPGEEALLARLIELPVAFSFGRVLINGGYIIPYAHQLRVGHLVERGKDVRVGTNRRQLQWTVFVVRVAELHDVLRHRYTPIKQLPAGSELHGPDAATCLGSVDAPDLAHAIRGNQRRNGDFRHRDLLRKSGDGLRTKMRQTQNAVPPGVRRQRQLCP